MQEIAEKEPELEMEDAPEEETEPDVRYEIISYPADHTLRGICDAWDEGEIKIPPFQRGFVWTISQASKLIESFLMGLPVPQVFLYSDPQNQNMVIDGQQRIMSIVYYMGGIFPKGTVGRNEIPFKLTNLQSRFNNKAFTDLDAADQRMLKGSVLRAINIDQRSPKDDTSIYHIFERLNTGGVALRPQEIRNCVFSGEFNKLLILLNKDKNWREILGREHEDKRQRDVELVLRIFALYGDGRSKYTSPMREFLNQAMLKHRSGETPEVKRFEKAFKKSAAIIVERLNKKPFHLSGALNAAALEAVFCVVLDHLGRLPADLREKYESCKLELKEDISKGRTSHVEAVKSRYEAAKRGLIG